MAKLIHEMACEGCGDVSEGDDLQPCAHCGEMFCRECFEEGDDGPVCFGCLPARRLALTPPPSPPPTALAFPPNSTFQITMPASVVASNEN